MESDDDDDSTPMVTIGNQQYAYHDVTTDMVARMTPHEKEEYIRIGQAMYESYYEQTHFYTNQAMKTGKKEVGEKDQEFEILTLASQHQQLYHKQVSYTNDY